MKLKTLALHNIPGIRPGFKIENIHPGLNIIVGPNASGKTSICQAVRRLLWPGMSSKHFQSASLHSEWQHNEDAFTIEVRNGNSHVSAAGKNLIERLPKESLTSCFSMTIDELFDAQDEEFAANISQEIAGGYDVESARNCFTSSVSARTAIKEWEQAEENFIKQKKIQDALRDQSRQLPELEQAIADAKAASSAVFDLEKIINLKILHDKISAKNEALKKFPHQLSKIKVSDADDYRQLLGKCASLEEEIAALSLKESTLKKMIGKWQELVLTEDELEDQKDRIGKIQHLESQKNQLLSEIAKLQLKVDEHFRVLGIMSDDDIENIQAKKLDQLEQEWEALEHLESEMAGIREQIRLNDPQKTQNPEILGQAAQILSDLASQTWISFRSLSIITVISFIFIGALFFFLTDETRFLVLGPLVALGVVWSEFFNKRKESRRLNDSYNALGLPSLKLNSIVREWAHALQVENQLQRKDDLEKLLTFKTEQHEALKNQLAQNAIKSGISILPYSRYRFASVVKDLHNSWLAIKEARMDLKQTSDALEKEWSLWGAFAGIFEENECPSIYELGKIHDRIRKHVEDIKNLKDIIGNLEKKNGVYKETKSRISALLTEAECDAVSLQNFVNQLSDYQQELNTLKNLKTEFEELKIKLGDKRAKRIEDDIQVLENEKMRQEEMSERLEELSTKKGNLKGQIDQIESASDGETLLQEQNEKLESLRLACRDFAKKELLDCLVMEVQKEFQRDYQPPVLEKGVDWFQRFTKSKFKLEAPSTESGRIVYEVVETGTGERRTLEQLSRGTRMQLLMSVRLSVAFHAEEKTIFLPIFLDEILANTDPERFDAVAEVMSELIASGRQIFYLTCNPEDAWKWSKRCPEAHLIDLAKVRKEQAFLAPPLPRVIEPSILKPSTQSLEEYVRELQLPDICIEDSLEMVSVHYLVDNVDDLYRLLDSGISTYGNFIHLKPHILENGFPHTAPIMKRRSQLLERFWELRKRGRGKPVTRDVLMEGGISKTFIDRIGELAEELKGDAKKLIALLEDKNNKDERKKGLRSQEALKTYLSEQGYLDERSILSDEEIRCELLPWTLEEQDLLFIEKLFGLHEAAV